MIKVYDDEHPEVFGIGECSIIPGLSLDQTDQIENELDAFCANVSAYVALLDEKALRFPALAFGIETALFDLQTGGKRILLNNDFSLGASGIPINGLVWMGSKEFMRNQVIEKIEAGFSVIKIKVGAIDFNEELDLIRSIRKEFDASHITIRLDANGAFTTKNALSKIAELSKYQIHSIEQPIPPGDVEAMYKVCRNGMIPIALDEELIGVHGVSAREALIRDILPDYIIIKPSLVGGMQHSDQWVRIAESMGVRWWATSALESNIGLNAIAQWTASKQATIPQGLGTGLLYQNNIPSPLEIKNASLWTTTLAKWDFQQLEAMN